MVNSQSSMVNPAGWRSQLRPVVDYDFRRTFLPVPAQHRAAVADVVDLVAWWNKKLTRPGKGARNKIRILDAPRFKAIRQLLAAFGADEIAAAIEWYSGKSWNRTTGHWKTADHFFTAAYVRTMIEELEEERERRAILEAGKTPVVARLAGEVAERMRIVEEKAHLKARFEALSDERKRALCEQGRQELLSLGRSPHGLNGWQCVQQAMVILKRNGPLTIDNGQLNGTAEARP